MIKRSQHGQKVKVSTTISCYVLDPDIRLGGGVQFNMFPSISHLFLCWKGTKSISKLEVLDFPPPPICHCKQHHQMEPEGKVRNQTSDLTELLVVFQVRLFQGRLRLVLQRLQLGCVFLSKSSYFQVFSRAPE